MYCDFYFYVETKLFSLAVSLSEDLLTIAIKAITKSSAAAGTDNNYYD